MKLHLLLIQWLLNSDINRFQFWLRIIKLNLKYIMVFILSSAYGLRNAFCKGCSLSGHTMPIFHWTFINGLQAIFWHCWKAFNLYFQILLGPHLPDLGIFFYLGCQISNFSKIQNLKYSTEILKLEIALLCDAITMITFTIKLSPDLTRLT